MKLRSRTAPKRLFRQLAAVGLLSWPMFAALVSLAEERKFLVILANMPRSFPAEPSPTGVDLPPGWAPGVPPIPMPSPADIEDVYYSHDPEDELGSFAEFWEEISCCIVRVTGKALGIIDLPWPQYPIFENETTTDDMVADESIHEDFSPSTQSNGLGFFDLNNAANFQFGQGEEVRPRPVPLGQHANIGRRRAQVVGAGLRSHGRMIELRRQLPRQRHVHRQRGHGGSYSMILLRGYSTLP